MLNKTFDDIELISLLVCQVPEYVVTLVCQVPHYVVTRDAVSFPDPMAEYVLGCILARERHLIEHHDNQQIRVW